MSSYQPQFAKQLSYTVEFDDLAGRQLLPSRPHRAERVCREIVGCLRADCRMGLTQMSRETRIPVSTLFDNLQRLRALRLPPGFGAEG